jgi:hypothetical protein
LIVTKVDPPKAKNDKNPEWAFSGTERLEISNSKPKNILGHTESDERRRDQKFFQKHNRFSMQI